MATTTIPWGDGSGDSIYLTYPSASEDQTVLVSSDANTGGARTKTITFTTGHIDRRLTVIQGGAVSGIPYIRGGSAGEYIDTGITADNTVKVIVWARNLLPTAGFLFGSRAAETQNTFGIAAYGGANTGRINLNYAQSNSTNTNDQFAHLGGYHKYEFYQGVLKIDDVTIASASSSTFSNSYNIHLIGMNTSGTHTKPTYAIDICACQIYKNGTLVRDFIAVNAPSIGLYDSVTQTLFTNAGTGTFQYGTFNPNAYTPIEYIECTGAQYFDSGYHASYYSAFAGKFRVDSSYTNDALFGYRSDTDWCEMTMGPNSNNSRCYWRLGSDSTWYLLYNATKNNFVNNDIVFVKRATPELTLYRNYSRLGTARTPSCSTSYVSSGTIYVGTEYWTTASPKEQKKFHGRIYYLTLGNKNFVPGKVNGVAGMYDTYNDVFYPSASDTEFVAGPEL